MCVELREETGYAGGDVWMLDQGDLSSVVSFAEKFNKDVSRLDVLVANAGISTSKYEATKDGYESTCISARASLLWHTLINNSLVLLPPQSSSEPFGDGAIVPVAASEDGRHESPARCQHSTPHHRLERDALLVQLRRGPDEKR